MDIRFKELLLVFLGCGAASVFLTPGSFTGLSVLGTTVVLSTVLGSSVLSSTVMASTVLGSTRGAMAIVEAYSNGVLLSEIVVSLVAIGLVIYTELSSPSYGKIQQSLVELRKRLMPMMLVNVILFGLTIAVKIWLFLI